MARDKAYRRASASLDGAITTVVATDLGNTITRYTYFDLARDGFSTFTLQHVITATTLTIEACNINSQPGTTGTFVCSGTDGTGATLVATTVNTVGGFAADDDLIGAQVIIVADATQPDNVGDLRAITDYAQGTGTLTLDSAVDGGATTSGVTSFRLKDSASPWSRRHSDPTDAQWVDVTNALTGAASATATGVWIVDTPLAFERIRIKRVTTNATNALTLRLTRGIA